MMATVIAGVAQFERELIQERIKSGLAAARARGRKLGRQPGQRPKSDRLAAKVISMVEEEKLSYRIVAKRLDLSKNTVLEIMKRNRRSGQSLTTSAF
jgi:DNA invertase Pin-like site-specific DNA recombinase